MHLVTAANDKHCKRTGDHVNCKLFFRVPSFRLFLSRRFDVGASFSTFNFGVNFSLKGCLHCGLVIKLEFLLTLDLRNSIW